MEGAVVLRSVLIVDDNAFVRHLLCGLFAGDAEFDVCGEAENGEDAIEKAIRLNPDLIVTDLSMPIMNGLEATRLLSQFMPAVPVIIYTAHADLLVEKEARAAGAAATVSKSDTSSLLQVARSFFRHQAAA